MQQRNVTMVSYQKIIIIFILSFCSIGCIPMIGAMVVQGFRPSYQDVKKDNSLPLLSIDKARLFMFKVGELPPSGAELCMASSWYGNRKLYFLPENGWLFTDLKPGRFTLEKKGSLGSDLDFDLKAGDEIFVVVGEEEVLKVVDAVYASEKLAAFTYALPDVESFDDSSMVANIRKRNAGCSEN